MGPVATGARAGGAGRVGALDSLRGLAALIVAINHCLVTFGWDERLDRPGLRLLLSGDGAVVLFFALSGLVLARTYIDKDRSYLPYAVKRVIRIYLPFAVAVLAAALLELAIGNGPIPGASHWFNDVGWHTPLSWQLVLRHLGMGDVIELDNATWSLFHEMRISLLLPVLAVAVVAEWRAALAVTLVLATGALLALPHVADRPLLANYLTSVEYLPLFAIGAAIGLRGAPLVRGLEALGGFWQLVLLAVALIALTHTPPSAVPIMGARPAFHLALCGGASAILLLFGLADTAFTRRVLDHPSIRYLGWISFSFYLVHLIVLQVLVRLTAGHWPHYVPVLLTVPLSIMIAHLMRVTVEDWAQQLGRRAAARLSGRIETATGGFGPGGAAA